MSSGLWSHDLAAFSESQGKGAYHLDEDDLVVVLLEIGLLPEVLEEGRRCAAAVAESIVARSHRPDSADDAADYQAKD